MLTRYKLIAALLFVTTFLGLTAFGIDYNGGDEALLTWGNVKAESSKITNVKQAEIIDALAKPIAITIGGKEAQIERATVNVFPLSTDPKLIYLVGGAFSAEAQAELQATVGWGTKIFFEEAVCTLKGKPKKIATITLKVM